MRRHHKEKPESARYEFRKPMWHWGFPFFLILCVWGLPALFAWVPGIRSSNPLLPFLRIGHGWLVARGLTVERACWLAALLSLPLVAAVYAGFGKLLITPEAIIRKLPFARPRAFRWVDMDEVHIDHVERWFEGRRTARRVLTLHGIPGRFVPWRSRMRVTNRQFSGYMQAERLAVQVAIPAIASRKRAQVRKNSKRTLFGTPGFVHDLTGVVYASLAAVFLFAWFHGALWREPYLDLRHVTPGVSVFFALLALRRLFFRYYAVDLSNLYVIRRAWGETPIPFDHITRVGVHDGKLEVVGRRKAAQDDTVLLRDRRFFRNRGVMIGMIRLAQEEKRQLDLTPITPFPAVRFAPGPEEGEQQRPVEDAVTPPDGGVVLDESGFDATAVADAAEPSLES
jgi:hypothetical protein